MERHRPPDAAAWPAISDLAERAHLALSELYAWYGANRDDLFPINRDETSMPAGAQEARRAESAAIAGALIEGHVAPGPPGRLVRAVAGHLVGYWTWRSLVVEQGLDHEAAVDFAVTILVEARGGHGEFRPGRGAVFESGWIEVSDGDDRGGAQRRADETETFEAGFREAELRSGRTSSAGASSSGHR
jgi:hypothetical protein